MQHLRGALVALVFGIALLVPSWVSAETCIACHTRDTPGAVAQWKASAHFGAKVGCEKCHGSEHTLIERGGAVVGDAVCGKCHEKESGEHAASKHGIGTHTGWGCTRKLPSRDESECGFCHREDTSAVVTRVQCARFLLQSSEMGQVGCNRCHQVESACGSCHTNHLTDLAVVRNPIVCAKCHMGPDHPQWEAWETSQHGGVNRALGPKHGPDCQRCHMAKTHDVSRGIAGAKTKDEGFDKERATMVAVCAECHAKKFAEKELARVDAVRAQSIALVKEAADIIADLHDNGLLDPGPGDRPEHPLRGDELVLDGDMVYENISHIERLFFTMRKYALAQTTVGATHQNPATTHWYGNAELKMLLVDIESEASRLRERGGSVSSTSANKEVAEEGGKMWPAKPAPPDPVQRKFRTLKSKFERGDLSADEYADEKARMLDELTGGSKKTSPAPEETPAPQP
jgi:hypothetical protein